jgi:hypothetical protein
MNDLDRRIGGMIADVIEWRNLLGEHRIQKNIATRDLLSVTNLNDSMIPQTTNLGVRSSNLFGRANNSDNSSAYDGGGDWCSSVQFYVRAMSSLSPLSDNASSATARAARGVLRAIQFQSFRRSSSGSLAKFTAIRPRRGSADWSPR